MTDRDTDTPLDQSANADQSTSPQTPETGEASLPPAQGPGIDPDLLEILVCPKTKGPLTYDRPNQELISETAGLAFPIRDGIPIMLVEEARNLNDNPS